MSEPDRSFTRLAGLPHEDIDYGVHSWNENGTDYLLVCRYDPVLHWSIKKWDRTVWTDIAIPNGMYFPLLSWITNTLCVPLSA